MTDSKRPLPNPPPATGGGNKIATPASSSTPSTGDGNNAARPASSSPPPFAGEGREGATVRELYDRENARLGHSSDRSQLAAIVKLDDLRLRLMKPRPRGLLDGLLGRKPRELERG